MEVLVLMKIHESLVIILKLRSLEWDLKSRSLSDQVLVNTNTRTQIVLWNSATPPMTLITKQVEKKLSLNLMEDQDPMITPTNLVMTRKLKSSVLDLKLKFHWVQVQVNISMKRLMEQSSNALKLGTLRIKQDERRLSPSQTVDLVLMKTLASLVTILKLKSSVSDPRLRFH